MITYLIVICILNLSWIVLSVIVHIATKRNHYKYPDRRELIINEFAKEKGISLRQAEQTVDNWIDRTYFTKLGDDGFLAVVYVYTITYIKGMLMQLRAN